MTDTEHCSSERVSQAAASYGTTKCAETNLRLDRDFPVLVDATFPPLLEDPNEAAWQERLNARFCSVVFISQASPKRFHSNRCVTLSKDGTELQLALDSPSG
ncbi:unnamed protein product [Prunus armeniaca]|uniref:Uncharacterized protein n=1 Tax=Prunus armeniaca TaxID=36596 RepID=A0A6J5UVD6_PRUAR|nr:unnamed protein product [Prunus armeniaca]